MKAETPGTAKKGRPTKDEPKLTEEERKERQREANTRHQIKKRIDETIETGELAEVKERGRKPKNK